MEKGFLETIEDKIKAFENDVDTSNLEKDLGETIEKQQILILGFPKELTFNI